METKCQYCRYFNRKYREYSVPEEFVDPPIEVDLNGERIKVPMGRWVGESSPIKVCSHPSCFTYKEKWSPVNGRQVEHVRITGQAQFNANGDCKYFKPKWWYWVLNKTGILE